MHVFTTVIQIQTFLGKKRSKGKTIAFVPTLGALHEGHLALMQRGHQIADLVVCSIFVNPTQFNDPKDLEKYPRPLREDIDLLTSIGVEVLFLPSDAAVYPPGVDLTVKAHLSYLTELMEGPIRPGHFEGVIKVVKRLLDIVQPNYLVMGQKDYQQQAIIGALIEQLQLPTKLVTHPTLRDKDGLALSSRNVRIDRRLRAKANLLYLSLQKAKSLMASQTPAEIIDICSEMITDHGFVIEYFTIIDGFSLQPVSKWAGHQKIVACVAAWLGEVRLIDNEILTPSLTS